MYRINIVFLLLVIVFTSCRSTKKISGAIASRDSTAAGAIDSRADSLKFIDDVYSSVIKNTIDFNTFSAKIKVDFIGGDGKKSDFNAFLRMKKDSVIWVSINAALGIEAFRIMITPDSVRVLNKIDKEIQERSATYLKEVSRIPFSFYDLQNLLIGNPVQLDSNIISYKQQDNYISLISIGYLYKHLLTVTENGKLLVASKLDDIDEKKARTALISYGGYEDRGNIKFPTTRKITASEKSKIDIDMQFKQFSFNEPLNFPFPVPKNYKRK